MYIDWSVEAVDHEIEKGLKQFSSQSDSFTSTLIHTINQQLGQIIN